MKTSARNQFTGTITQVTVGAVNDEIALDVPGLGAIVAIVTHGSAVRLGLKVGTKAVALIKASSVIVVTNTQDVQFSARNHLQGQVTNIQTGAVNTEVLISLPGGAAVTAIITNESASTLELAVGTSAAALFKASSVILGVQQTA